MSDSFKSNKPGVFIILFLSISIFIGSRYLYIMKRNDRNVSGIIIANEIVVCSLDYGKVQKIFVNESDNIKGNDLLIQLDSNLIDNKIKQILAAIDYEKTKENLLRIKEDKALEDYLNCKKEKNNDGNKVNNKLQLLETIQSLHHLQLKQIVKLETELLYYNERKKNLCIYSPCNGIIQNLFVQINQNIKLSEKLLTISQNEHLWMAAKIPISKYKIGDDLNIFIENYPDSKFQGKIFAISNINTNMSSKYAEAKLSVNQIKIHPNDATLPLINGMKAYIKYE